MRTLAIGDMHGCLTALETLLDVVAPSEEDQLVTLGDYVDRGPDSRGVIERLLALDRECHLVPLRGNHELMMLDAKQLRGAMFWRLAGGTNTLASYDTGVAADIPEAFRDVGSLEFSKLLLKHANVAVSPGNGFGEYGEGYVRLALVENRQRIMQAARNVRRFIDTSGVILEQAEKSAAGT